MARPITWQDVAGPSQVPGTLLAMNQAGQSAAEAFSGIGKTLLAVRDDNRKLNTDAVIASIANSQDPAAVAAAAPQGWQFDPLAIAGAANDRSTQLQQARATEQNIKASESTIASQEAIRKDMEDKRLGAELAQPFLNAIQSGKYKGVPDGTFAEKGQGGIYAQEAIQRALREREDFKLRARAANVAERQYLDQRAQQDYLGWARAFGASAEGQKMDRAELDRRLVAEAQRRGLPATLADTGTLVFEKGAQANSATEAELDTRMPGSGGKTYRDAVSTLTTIQSQAKNQISEKLAQPWDGKEGSPSFLQLQEFAARAPAFTDGALPFVASELASKAEDMDQEEAQSRIRRIKAEYPHLTYGQAASLALDSQHRWNWALRNPATATEVKVGAAMYKKVDELGGKEGIDRKAAEKTAAEARTLSELPGLARQLSGSARSGTDAPKQILQWDAEIAKARADKAAEEARAAADAAAKALERFTPPKERY